MSMLAELQSDLSHKENENTGLALLNQLSLSKDGLAFLT